MGKRECLFSLAQEEKYRKIREVKDKRSGDFGNASGIDPLRAATEFLLRRSFRLTSFAQN